VNLTRYCCNEATVKRYYSHLWRPQVLCRSVYTYSSSWSTYRVP